MDFDTHGVFEKLIQSNNPLDCYRCCNRNTKYYKLFTISYSLKDFKLMYNNQLLTGLVDVGYNIYGRDWLAFKEGRKKLQAMKTVSASLQNDRGIWTIRGRVCDPETGQTHNSFARR